MTEEVVDLVAALRKSVEDAKQQRLARDEAELQERRIGGFVAKVAAESIHAEPPHPPDLRPEALAKQLAGCVKPPTEDELPLIAERWIAEYMTWKDTVRTEVDVTEEHVGTALFRLRLILHCDEPTARNLLEAIVDDLRLELDIVPTIDT